MVCLCLMMSVASAETSQRLEVTRWAGDQNHLEAYLLMYLAAGTEDWKTGTANWNTSMWLGFLTAWQPQSSQISYLVTQSSKSRHPPFKVRAVLPFTTQPQKSRRHSCCILLARSILEASQIHKEDKQSAFLDDTTSGFQKSKWFGRLSCVLFWRR